MDRPWPVVRQLWRTALAQHNAWHPGGTRVPRQPRFARPHLDTRSKVALPGRPRLRPWRAALLRATRRLATGGSGRVAHPTGRSARAARCVGSGARSNALHDRAVTRRQRLHRGRDRHGQQLVDRTAAPPLVGFVPRARLEYNWPLVSDRSADRGHRPPGNCAGLARAGFRPLEPNRQGAREHARLLAPLRRCVPPRSELLAGL